MNTKKQGHHHEHHHHGGDQQNGHGKDEHEHQHDEHANHDHTEHHKMMIKDFRKRFWVSLIITLPILVLSPMVQEIIGYQINFRFDNYVLFGLSALLYFYGGWPFMTGFIKEIKDRQPGMMTLVFVAITVAFGYSTATTFGLEGKKFFWELATLIDIMLLGHWIEMKSVVGASKSLQKLVEMMPSTAYLQKDGEVSEVKIDQLKKDDVVLIKPGEKIPVDGIIIKGESNIDESMVTGESKPVKKAKEDNVVGGTINGNGSLEVSVQQVGEEAYLSKVIQMIRDAQGKKSKTQHLADRIAFYLTITALLVGFGTLATWLMLGKPFVFALERMTSVMVIACPHALGLAVPLVVAISTTKSASRGLLIRNRTAFENARKITLIAFDKTGTLTKGNFGVTQYESLNDDLKDDDMLRLAGALEAHSEHPLAQGIMNKINEVKIEVPEIEKFNAISGKGIEGEVDNRKVKVVSPGFLTEMGIEIPDSVETNKQDTIVFLLVDDKLAGFIAMGDEIREESYEAIKKLKKDGVKVFMMTGDNENVAKSVSEALGLDGYFAGMLPDDKLRKTEEFKEKGEFVVMTGDGINDAPALAAADVSIAIGSGTDVAAETADIILVNSNPMDVTNLIRFGKETYKKMIQNFVWATGYNVIAIPLAAGVLYNVGIVINPALGAGLMSLSTVIVAINAQLLKRKFSVE